jgi:hypothetical protein
MSYKDLRNFALQQAIQKLFRYDSFKDVKVIQSISKLGKKLDEAKSESDEVFKKLVKSYAVLDEKGEIKLDTKGAFEVPDEKTAEWSEKIKEYDATMVEFDAPKLSADKLVKLGCPLSALDLTAMEAFLVADLEVVG